MNLHNRIRQLEIAAGDREVESFDISRLSPADQERVAELEQKAGDAWNLAALDTAELMELRDIVRRATVATEPRGFC